MPINYKSDLQSSYAQMTNLVKSSNMQAKYTSSAQSNNYDNNHLTSLFEQLGNGLLTLTKIRLNAKQNADYAESFNHTYTKWQKIIGLPAYYWVLIAQFFIILPHIAYLPTWLIGFGILTVIAQFPIIKVRVSSWRIGLKRVYQIFQLIGFFGGIFGLWLTYGLNFGVDMGVAFLVLCLIGKLWEVYKRRDAYVILNLSMFVMAALLLMDQGLTATLQALLGTGITLLAFITMNDDGNLQGTGRLRSFSLLVGFALPLMVVLFLFFPRLPPLWSLQLSGSQATTGVSDSMSPGDFANLSQSTELAFRAEFEGGVPPQTQLYWRGLVYSDFDGVTWTRNEAKRIWRNGEAPEWIKQSIATLSQSQKDNPVKYRIALEPTQRRWLYGLDYPFTQDKNVLITSEFTLLHNEPVTKQTRYEAVQFSNMRIDTALNARDRQINLALPEQGNQQSYQYAKSLYASSGNDPIKYIEAITKWINTDNFRYTLSPPPLQSNRIDDFLFGTKAGFCEHYSSSFTYLMRAAGIPARVIGGYQGGERGRDGVSWEVRQLDAHAWSEVWLEGQGWVRIDPTAFVAPTRVEQGMNALTSQQGAAMFGSGAVAQLNYQQFKMLQSLRRLTDQASYYWQRDIVGFDKDRQAGSLFKWFKIKSVLQQVMWMVIAAAVVMIFIITFIWVRRRRKWHPADVPIIALSKKMAKRDARLAIDPDEGVLSWLNRLEAYMYNQSNGNNQRSNQTFSKDSIHTDSLNSQIQHNNETQNVINQLKTNYRRLRYGRQSELDIKSTEYKLGLRRLKSLVAQLKSSHAK